jgi:hypothetical protein
MMAQEEQQPVAVDGNHSEIGSGELAGVIADASRLEEIFRSVMEPRQLQEWCGKGIACPLGVVALVQPENYQCTS